MAIYSIIDRIVDKMEWNEDKNLEWNFHNIELMLHAFKGYTEFTREDVLEDYRDKVSKALISNLTKHPRLMIASFNTLDYTLGMTAAEIKLGKVVDYILDNSPMACTQQNTFGENIGMICAQFKLEPQLKKAMGNFKARRQLDEKNNSMYDYAVEEGMHFTEEEHKKYASEKKRILKKALLVKRANKVNTNQEVKAKTDTTNNSKKGRVINIIDSATQGRNGM